ncbi:DUF4405 domain-containing protein [Desulfosporosinus fructosivorans]|uniref:DUF4405 domain-containing protein n=1 Tax=Desulfosporosinus fructosivorans TaxID=2018669 RepID=A0A4Z0R3G3_9FIRM|nr:DUF4405 domain-containing protein [Desulfosporosinus fructosivorans]TGE36176.1 DUF4405 domain-containing protein [Desulfosporosinus fructosivorans]
MNNKTTIKLTLDFAMTVVFLRLLDAHSTGLVFHEIVGLSIITLFMAHILLNWSWVKTFAKNLFCTKFKIRPRLMYVLNLGLLMGISTITITGILISQVIFPSGSNGNSILLVTVHKLVSYSCLGLIAIHILLHRKYILASMRNMFAHGEMKTVLVLGAVVVIGLFFTQTILGSDKRLTYATTPPTVSSRNSTIPQTKDDQTNATLEDTQENGQTVSLSDFLGNMFCTGCSKHCSLLNLGCAKGDAQLQIAKTEYQNLYGQTASNTTIEDPQENSQNSNITPKDTEVNDQSENNRFFRDEKPSKDVRQKQRGSHGSAFRHM